MGGTFSLKGIRQLKEDWPNITNETVYDLIEDCEYMKYQLIKMQEAAKLQKFYSRILGHFPDFSKLFGEK